jgi:hypothetical protein
LGLLEAVEGEVLDEVWRRNELARGRGTGTWRGRNREEEVALGELGRRRSCS